MNRKTFLFFAIVTAALLPATATAAIIINDPILVSTHQNNAVVYIANGPGYAQAQAYGFMSTDYSAAGENVTIDLNYTQHGGVSITNALELVNGASSAASVYLNGTLPDFITWYYSASPVSSATAPYGTPITTGTPITVNANSQVYITVVINTLNSPGYITSADLTLQYTLS
ncbi:MAG: hypothetical protein QW597_04815 [Thermoplasmataceae archaeon]